MHLDFYGEEMLSSSEPFLLKGESFYEEENTPKFPDANLNHASSMPVRPKAPWHVLADTSSEEEEKVGEGVPLDRRVVDRRVGSQMYKVGEAFFQREETDEISIGQGFSSNLQRLMDMQSD